MPIYCYHCPECDSATDIVRPIRDRDRMPMCVGCERPMERFFAAEGVGSDTQEFSKPFVSPACGVNVNQIAEARTRFPHHLFNRGGDMVFTSPAHMKRCLKDIGFADKNG